MKFVQILALLLLTISTVCCKKKIMGGSQSLIGVTEDGEDDVIFWPEDDINTVANYKEVSLMDYVLDLELDFDGEIIKGDAKLTFESIIDLKKIQLDAWHISVTKIEFECTKEQYPYPVDKMEIDDWEDDIELNPTMGGTIFINVDKVLEHVLPDGETLEYGFIPADTAFYIYIEYQTLKPKKGVPSGFSFVKTHGTHGKTHPFFYTQNQPIYARTWIPCFDTPIQRSTFEMNVKVPKDLQVYSAIEKHSEIEVGNSKTHTFKHIFPKVATWNIALIAGNLQEKEIKENVFILCDDGELMEEAVDRLFHLPDWINLMSEMIGINYANERFQIAIMPPNYPFEGAQHGILTYASPTILRSGKRGQAVVFHEIACNYFGNDVSAANWRNLWMNEGMATFLEREAQNLFFGAAYPELDRIDGNFTFVEALESIDVYGLDPTFKTLHPETKLRNPEESFTAVAFEKGYQLMAYFQQLMLTHNVFHLLRDWIIDNRYQVVDQAMFADFVVAWVDKNLDAKDGEAILQEIDWDAWINEPGFPPKNTIKHFTSDQYNEAAELADKFIQFNGAARPSNYINLLKWTQDQQYAFLDYFAQHTYMMSPRILKELDNLYEFRNSEDYNILSRWFALIALNRYSTPENNTLMGEFLGSTGRISQVIPVYEGLVGSGQTSKADEYLIQNQNFYHPTTIEAIELVIFRVAVQ